MNPKLERPRRHVHRLKFVEDRDVKAEPTDIMPSARVLEKSPSPNNGHVFMSAIGIYVLLSVVGVIAFLG